MIYKKQARALGKEIRKQTGIHFTIAMGAAKKIVRGQARELTYSDNFPKFEKVLEWQRLCQGGDPQCDCMSRWVLKGPKGEYALYI